MLGVHYSDLILITSFTPRTAIHFSADANHLQLTLDATGLWTWFPETAVTADTSHQGGAPATCTSDQLAANSEVPKTPSGLIFH